jgi:hypothetical protein
MIGGVGAEVWGEGVKAYMVTKTLLKEKRTNMVPLTHRNGIQNLDVD